jgi:hypothetical protein
MLPLAYGHTLLPHIHYACQSIIHLYSCVISGVLHKWNSALYKHVRLAFVT